ncbi:hypothetical protein C0993_003991 [Termitomyces sp. T159_Od127]|nr:hypothetical protein C0993_003991 [Termitomyces sp. T159_Od127]
MDLFNPKILDASIRDVASCLTDNQKADLLLYAMRSLHLEGRSLTHPRPIISTQNQQAF